MCDGWWWDETLRKMRPYYQLQKVEDGKFTRWLMVRWWEYTFFYVYFLFCCLFASNGDYGLLFFQQYLLCCSVCGGCISSGVQWFALKLWWRKAKELKMKIRKELPSGQQWGFNKGEISFQEAYIYSVLARVKASRGDFCCWSNVKSLAQIVSTN